MYFSRKIGLFDNKELQFMMIGNSMLKQRNKGEECFLMDFGGTIVRQEFIGKN